MPIRTNKLSLNVDYRLFDNNYEVFSIKTSEDYFKSGSYVLDLPELSKKINSIRFKRGNEIHVLMNRSDDNKRVLIDSLKKTKEHPTITVQKLSSKSIDDHILLQLLLNGLGNYKMNQLRFNNLTGRLHCFRTGWFERSRKSDGERILKVPTLEIRVDDEMVLHLDVHTFTSELLKKKIEFKKKKYDAYPKYVLSNNNTLHRKLSDEKEIEFIMRQTRNCKKEIPFLNIHDIDGFNESKMGVLEDVVEKFTKRYKDIASIEFEEIDDYASLDYTRLSLKEDQVAVLNALSASQIKLIDEIGDQYSAEFSKRIANLFKAKYGLIAKTGKRPSKECLNIRIIHNSVYYDGSEDPYKKKYEGFALQHITFEDFSDCAEAAVQTIVHELLIKRDLVEGRISLFDWKKLGLTETISFGASYMDEKEIDHYLFMAIDPDGSFKIKEQELNLFEANEYDDCVDIFSESSQSDNSVKGIIKSPSKGINIIKDTGIITLPDTAAIKAHLKNGETQLRGKEKRDELMSSILDIKAYKQGDKLFYFAGTIGNGMRWKIDRAANVRSVDCYKDSGNFFETLLPTVSVTFVKNGQLTVVPFPFKYLREYYVGVSETY